MAENEKNNNRIKCKNSKLSKYDKIKHNTKSNEEEIHKWKSIEGEEMQAEMKES